MTLLSIKRPIFIRVVHYSSEENTESGKFLESIDREADKLDTVSSFGRRSGFVRCGLVTDSSRWETSTDSDRRAGSRNRAGGASGETALRDFSRYLRRSSKSPRGWLSQRLDVLAAWPPESEKLVMRVSRYFRPQRRRTRRLRVSRRPRSGGADRR